MTGMKIGNTKKRRKHKQKQKPKQKPSEASTEKRCRKDDTNKKQADDDDDSSTSSSSSSSSTSSSDSSTSSSSVSSSSSDSSSSDSSSSDSSSDSSSSDSPPDKAPAKPLHTKRELNTKAEAKVKTEQKPPPSAAAAAVAARATVKPSSLPKPSSTPSSSLAKDSTAKSKPNNHDSSKPLRSKNSATCANPNIKKEEKKTTQQSSSSSSSSSTSSSSVSSSSVSSSSSSSSSSTSSSTSALSSELKKNKKSTVDSKNIPPSKPPSHIEIMMPATKQQFPSMMPQGNAQKKTAKINNNESSSNPVSDDTTAMETNNDDNDNDKRISSKHKRKRSARPTLYDDDDSDVYYKSSNNNNNKADNKRQKKKSNSETTNLGKLKQSILGRKLETNLEGTLQDELNELQYQQERLDDQNAKRGALLVKRLDGLQKDLTCPICYEVLLDPVSLPCGHSFCKGCLEWWVNTSQNTASNTVAPQESRHTPKCPTCRAPILGGTFKDWGFQVNTCLRACIVAFFPKELEERLKARLDQQKGEAGGRHVHGYKPIYTLEESSIRYPMRTMRKLLPKDDNPLFTVNGISVQRSIALDAMDQRMRLGLALYGPIEEIVEKTTASRKSKSNSVSIRVTLCVVELEEDEVEEGMPLVIRPNTYDEDFVLTDRFAGSLINQSKIVDSTRNSTSSNHAEQRIAPLGRRQLLSDGKVAFSTIVPFQKNDDSSKANNAFVFHHEETGLQLKLALKSPLKGDRPKLEGLFMDSEEDQDSDQNDSTDHEESSTDNNVVFGAEGGDVGEYEDDGFVVNDHEANDDNDAQSHNECDVCGLGGELLICDGGDHATGCGKCFHLECIGLTSIPSGDWICSSCASKEGLTFEALMGHEFTSSTPNPETNDEDQSDASSECEFDQDKSAKGDENHQSSDKSAVTNRSASMERRPSKRRVILDSDEESES